MLFRRVRGWYSREIYRKSGENALAEFSRTFELRFDLRGSLRGDLRVNWRENWRDNLWMMRGFFLFLNLFFLAVVAGSITAKAGGIQNQAATAAGPGLTFAIADFDGDHHLDQASIQTGRGAEGDSTYWIQFQCSTAGRQFIRLVAPAGGLLMEARDVNGDHTVDLVFSTAWFRQPVAVLLNDGHGKFLRADPGAFPGAFRESHTSLLPATSVPAGVVGLPPQPDAGMQAAADGQLHRRSPAGLALAAASDSPVDPFLFFSAGRAPPSVTSYL